MKRLILGAAAVAAAATVAFPSMAGASGNSGGNSVSIDQYADFNFAGTQLDLGLQVSCTGNTGIVNVTVDQAYPDSPSPLGAHGTGVQDVVCDGKTHYVTVTVIGTLFDGGKATAKVTLMAPSGTSSTQRQVSVRAT